MGVWRVRLLGADGDVVVWQGEAADGFEAQTLAEAEHPGAVTKSGSEVEG